MRTLRENAYAKHDPGSISEPVFQLWEERVSTLRGSDVQPTPLVPVTVHLVSRCPLAWMQAVHRDAACATHRTPHTTAPWGHLFHRSRTSVGKGPSIKLWIIAGCVQQCSTKRYKKGAGADQAVLQYKPLQNVQKSSWYIKINKIIILLLHSWAEIL